MHAATDNYRVHIFVSFYSLSIIRLEGNWGVQPRAPFNLVTFHFVHPPNVSTVVFGMKQPVLMHSRKTSFFCLERTQFVASEHKVPGQPKRRRAFGTAQGLGQATASRNVRAPMFSRRLHGGSKICGRVLQTQRNPATHTKLPNQGPDVKELLTPVSVASGR